MRSPLSLSLSLFKRNTVTKDKHIFVFINGPKIIVYSIALQSKKRMTNEIGSDVIEFRLIDEMDKNVTLPPCMVLLSLWWPENTNYSLVIELSGNMY